jgi:hypothetical protein
MSSYEKTYCCGLVHIHCNNEDTITDIKNTINNLKKNNNYDYERCGFIIIKENEKILEKRIKKIGFKFVKKFKRNKSYSTGYLKMYIKTWK